MCVSVCVFEIFWIIVKTATENVKENTHWTIHFQRMCIPYERKEIFSLFAASVGENRIIYELYPYKHTGKYAYGMYVCIILIIIPYHYSNSDDDVDDSYDKDKQK